MVILIPISTKELHQEGWGTPHPPHKDVDAAPHQDSKDGRHPEYKLEQLSSIAHKVNNLALTLKLELV